MDVEVLDLILRGAACGVLALIAIRIAAAGPARLATVFAAALCVSLICYILVSSLANHLDSFAWETWLVVPPGFTPFLLWWSFLSLFDDGFRWRHWHLVPLGLVFVPTQVFGFVPGMELLRGVSVAALYVHLIFVAVVTAADDLDEPRRRFRRWFLVWAAVTGLITTYVEVTHDDAELTAWVYPLHGAALLALASAFSLWSSRMRPDLWAAPQRVKPSAPAGADPRTSAMAQKLGAAMDEGIWRREGLTIGALATELGVPEHQLRRLINAGLGYRNFSAFINDRRIDAAREMLADPEKAATPILTIAFDLGYASLGPFNRAFRERVDMSPTDFRKKALTSER